METSLNEWNKTKNTANNDNNLDVQLAQVWKLLWVEGYRIINMFYVVIWLR